jgi:hypothetical protein
VAEQDAVIGGSQIGLQREHKAELDRGQRIGGEVQVLVMEQVVDVPARERLRRMLLLQHLGLPCHTSDQPQHRVGRDRALVDHVAVPQRGEQRLGRGGDRSVALAIGSRLAGGDLSDEAFVDRRQRWSVGRRGVAAPGEHDHEQQDRGSRELTQTERLDRRERDG